MKREEVIRYLAEEAAADLEEREHLEANVDRYMEDLTQEIQAAAADLVDSGQVRLVRED